MHIYFSSPFVCDSAVLDILATRLTLCARLNTFIAGDADTGSGSRVSEQEFVQFIRNCPNMKLMSLDSHTQLGKDALLAIVESCPKLEALRITGHDRGDHRALAALATACESNPDLAKNLRDLNLTDQHISHDNERAIKKLQKVCLRLLRFFSWHP
ncbi:hypothetical protein EV359DRAFT_50133 [Lentinula novae-zelandiae]|nr:hypothetical protein EV359DRAFT_50133 [Lentinula novae-zelandiae]